MLKNEWRPSATIEVLKARADFFQQIRHFFQEKNVIEVDPPLLCRSAALEPHLAAFAVPETPTRYLQTSPEFPMKRLVAAGSGPIYSLGKSFRQAEVGKRHNPEFTMLEWYRPHWDHLQLLEEVETLFKRLLNCHSFEQHTYQDLFESYFEINPYEVSIHQLKTIALKKGWANEGDEYEKDGWLDLLFTHEIESKLGMNAPWVISDYPASMASLAQIKEVNGYKVAQRFEVYYKGIELANGYHELGCQIEQRFRFQEDLNKREQLNLPIIPMDEQLLASLEAFPECAGVAVGVDRLLMIKLEQTHIARILPFAWDNC